MTAAVLLRDPMPENFQARVLQLQDEVLALLDADANQALLILVNLAASDPHQQHATQALLATVLCELAARSLDAIAPDQRASLRAAALTHHMAMAGVQDQLALQDTPASAPQQAKVDAHVARALDCLHEAGVTDEFWLEAVAHHPPGPARPADRAGPGPGDGAADRLRGPLRRRPVGAQVAARAAGPPRPCAASTASSSRSTTPARPS